MNNRQKAVLRGWLIRVAIIQLIYFTAVGLGFIWTRNSYNEVKAGIRDMEERSQKSLQHAAEMNALLDREAADREIFKTPAGGRATRP